MQIHKIHYMCRERCLWIKPDHACGARIARVLARAIPLQAKRLALTIYVPVVQ